MTAATVPQHFWLGTGLHFALEDYHGWNFYGSPIEAFKAYVYATRKLSVKKFKELALEFDSTYEESSELLEGMLNHYMNWLKRRDPLQTYIYQAQPQVEVRFQVPIPIDLADHPWYTSAVYEGKLDRVIIDEYGGLWIVEYKSAKQFDTLKLDTDAQISAYCWIASHIYDKPIQGVIYQQHKKLVPQAPALLRTGLYSAAVDQSTTWDLYNGALTNLYGDPSRAPENNIKCLNHLASLEDERSDKYIRRDIASRNVHQMEAEGTKLLLELEDMFNPDLPLYPNPTWDCSWDCKEFITPCILLDSGGDWQAELEASTRSRYEADDAWRRYLPHRQEDEVLQERDET